MTDPPQDPSEYHFGPVEAEGARLCIRAAELCAAGRAYADIATELGLDSPLEAKRCAEVGFSLAPGEDLRMRRTALAADNGGDFARARKCLQAAELRAQGTSWQDIQRELELDDVMRAKKLADLGWLICKLVS